MCAGRKRWYIPTEFVRGLEATSRGGWVRGERGLVVSESAARTRPDAATAVGRIRIHRLAPPLPVFFPAQALLSLECDPPIPRAASRARILQHPLSEHDPQKMGQNPIAIRLSRGTSVKNVTIFFKPRATYPDKYMSLDSPTSKMLCLTGRHIHLVHSSPRP